MRSASFFEKRQTNRTLLFGKGDDKMTKEEKRELMMFFSLVAMVVGVCFLATISILTGGYILLFPVGLIFILLIVVIIENKDVIYFPWRREKYKTKKNP